MEIKLQAFGIAKDILGSSKTNIHVENVVDIHGLKQQLIQSYPEFEKLKSLKFALHESYVDDEALLKDGDEVVVIPPVSGG